VGLAGLIGVEDGDDVRVVQLGGQLGLAVEPFHGSGLSQPIGIDDLQGDDPVNQTVLGTVDRPHPPRPEPVENPVARVVKQVKGTNLPTSGLVGGRKRPILIRPHLHGTGKDR
jgi:hypothetical protein